MSPKSAYPAISVSELIAEPRRLWATVLVSALVPALLFCALGAYALMRSRAQYEQRAELLTQNLATAVDLSVSANIQKIDLSLGSIVDQLETQLAHGALDADIANSQIRSQIARHPELEGVRVTDAQGIGILGPGLAGRTPVDFSQREWFVAQRDNPTVGLFMSGPLVSKIDGSWIVSFSRRYRRPDGSFAGGVTAAVPLRYFTHQLEAINVGAHGAVILRDAKLGMITRFPPPRQEAAGKVGSRTVSPELRALVESGKTQATFHAHATADAVERTTTFRRLTEAPILVIVGLGTQDYLSDWYGEVRTVVGFCTGVVGLYAVGCALMLRVLAKYRQARQRIDLLAKVFEHSGEAIMMTDREHRIVEINPSFVRQTGYTPAEVIGCHPNDLTLNRGTQHDAMWEAIRTTGLWHGELWDRTKDGRDYPKWTSVSAVRDAQGEISHHISTSIDMTQVKQAEQKILHLAHHDPLTGLPNRVFLQRRLEEALTRGRREGRELAVLFIDMDRFKDINDTLGHHVGDDLLVEVGKRLQGVVRSTDFVARLGGDEFVLVLGGDCQKSAHAAAVVAGKLVTLLGQPYRVSGHELHSTPSIGVSIFPFDGDDAGTLMKNADAAMYCAKSSGRNSFKFFTQAMNQATAQRLSLEAGLRTAIERDELSVHYQPQMELGTDRIVGVEALLRWNHPERGLVPPLQFIPIAEDTGQIESIGSWVLDRALAQVACWRHGRDADLRVAVNVSAHQLRSDAFADVVAQALRRHHLPGSALELEITESTAMRDPIRTSELLLRLRTLGVAVAIDDFGTGYSSLAYLKQLPLSCLKLDRSFVTDIERDANDAAICTATIQLAHSLGLGVVAEGVESPEQLAFLRKLGCDKVQGFHIGRPLAAGDCERFLQGGTRGIWTQAVA